MRSEKTGTKRWRRRIGWALLGFFALSIVACIGGFLWLRTSLPRTDGTITLDGLGASVEIVRDADGIVVIKAESEADAAFALGFVHAQDRLWQMDFLRRVGAGRLSEVIGSGALSIDRFIRTLGFYRLAKRSLQYQPPEVLTVLESYAAGVNAVIAAPGGALPPEFQLLRYSPERWRPADSLVWGRLMALELSGNWREELLRARLVRRLTPEQVAFLWPGYPPDGPVTIARAGALDDLPLRALAKVLPWRFQPKEASNVWALSGERTASGKPLLANDPHLALEAPGLWYLVRIETPTLTLAGASVPGVPFLVLGHNGQVAWGLTTTHSDTQDLFIEHETAGRPGFYDTPEGPRPFEARKETILVKGGDPVVLTVRATRHGPVISDAMGQASDDGTLLALAWPALEENDRTAAALYAMNRAKSVEEFRHALDDFHAPQQNIAYADTNGHIALMAPARVPIRKAGDGTLPVPGWTGDYDWVGYVPYDELPQRVDPPDGRIINANNKLVGADYSHFMTAHWFGPQRAARILDRLDALSRPASVEAMTTIQLDDTSRDALALLPHLVEATDELPAEARSLFTDWDGSMAADSAAPLLYHAWRRSLGRLTFADELGPDFGDFRPSARLLKEVFLSGAIWCDDTRTTARESCAQISARAMREAWAELSADYGADPSAWRWGEAHVAAFRHPIWSRVPLLSEIFSFGVESAGSDDTVNRGGVRLSAEGAERYDNIHGPGYRAVYNLADLESSRFVIATGQSGNPLSPLYGSFVERWRGGDYISLGENAIVPAHRLHLEPK